MMGRGPFAALVVDFICRDFKEEMVKLKLTTPWVHVVVFDRYVFIKRRKICNLKGVILSASDRRINGTSPRAHTELWGTRKCLLLLKWY